MLENHCSRSTTFPQESHVMNLLWWSDKGRKRGSECPFRPSVRPSLRPSLRCYSTEFVSTTDPRWREVACTCEPLHHGGGDSRRLANTQYRAGSNSQPILWKARPATTARPGPLVTLVVCPSFSNPIFSILGLTHFIPAGKKNNLQTHNRKLGS